MVLLVKREPDAAAQQAGGGEGKAAHLQCSSTALLLVGKKTQATQAHQILVAAI